MGAFLGDGDRIAAFIPRCLKRTVRVRGAAGRGLEECSERF
jgi:hypothetical protein